MKRFRVSILGAALLACAVPPAIAFSGAATQAALLGSDYPNPLLGQQSEIKTFTGRISRNGQRFVLEDTSLRTSYQLDDQQKAEKYQGKNVRVIGTLDAENNMIHVQSIEEAV